MYEIEISKNKKIDIADFAEVGAVLKKKTVEKEEFYIEISKEIENMYNIINISGKIQKNPKLNILFIAAKGEKLIDKIYHFLVKGNGDFIKYYESIEIDDSGLEKAIQGIDSYRKEDSVDICFNMEEIKQKYKEYGKDEMGIFYYVAFTKFFLESYLLQMVTMFVDIYKGGSWSESEVIELHNYLVNIFSEDFAKAFRIFEEKEINKMKVYN